MGAKGKGKGSPCIYNWLKWTKDIDATLSIL